MEENESVSRQLTGAITSNLVGASVESTVVHYWRCLMVEKEATKEETVQQVIDLLKHIAQKYLGTVLLEEQHTPHTIRKRMKELRDVMKAQAVQVPEFDELYKDILHECDKTREASAAR